MRVDLTSSDPAAANELVSCATMPCRPARPTTPPTRGRLQANQFAVIPSTTAGIYYVLVHGQSEPGAATAGRPAGQRPAVRDHRRRARQRRRQPLRHDHDPGRAVRSAGDRQAGPAGLRRVRAGQLPGDGRHAHHRHLRPAQCTARPLRRGGDQPQRRTSRVHPTATWSSRPCRPTSPSRLGGPRVVWAGNSGLYGFTLTSQTNVDIPYVEFQYGVPALPLNEGVPYLRLHDQCAAEHPNVADVPWASRVADARTRMAQLLTTGYALTSPTAPTRPSASWFRPIRTACPRCKYRAARRHRVRVQHHGRSDAADARRIRRPADAACIDACARTSCRDPTASVALQNLAADADSWTALYLAALTAGRPVAAGGPAAAVHDNPVWSACRPRWLPAFWPGRPANQIITNGNLAQFFDQVRHWYGDDPTKTTPYVSNRHDRSARTSRRPISASTRRPRATSISISPHRTHYRGDYVYVPWANDWDLGIKHFDPDTDQTHPENPNFINVQLRTSPRSSPGTGRSGQAIHQRPAGLRLRAVRAARPAAPFTIQFANGANASATVGEVRIVSATRPELRPAQLPPGRLAARRLQVHIPNGVGSFQGDFDFTKSKGFILRVSAGIDIKLEHRHLAASGHRPAHRRGHPGPDQGAAAARQRPGRRPRAS